MTEPRTKLSRFIAELQRRHVVRVAIGYAAVAFVVLQAGEIVLPTFGKDAWLQLLVIFVMLGFPVVMVLAWVFDITSQGIVRTHETAYEGAGPVLGDAMMPKIALLVVTLISVGAAGLWAIRASQGVAAGVGTPAPVTGVALVAYDPSAPIRSLAVLPLDDFSAPGAKDYFTAGMHEELITQLSQIQSIRVASRTSVTRFAGTQLSMPEIGQQLGVDVVVEGSVLRTANAVRITVQLIHAASDTHIWSQSYERDLTDIIALQGEVARAIAEEIQGELSVEDRALFTGRTASKVPKAQEEYLLGMGRKAENTLEGNEAAVGHFAEAVMEDPSFAEGYSQLANAQLWLEMSRSEDEVPDPEAVIVVRETATKALELDPNLQSAQALVRFVDDELMGANPSMVTVRSEEGQPRVLVLDGEHRLELEDGNAMPAGGEMKSFGPDSGAWVTGVTNLGRDLQRLWARRMETQVRRGGNDPESLVHVARLLRGSGQHEQAVAMLEQISEQSPDLAEVWEQLEVAYALTGDFDEIVELWDAQAEMGQMDPDRVESLTLALEEDGPSAYWEMRVEGIEASLQNGEAVSHVDLARAYAGAEEPDAAFRELERAYRARDREIASILTDPVWDAYRTDPRFREFALKLRQNLQRRRVRSPGN